MPGVRAPSDGPRGRGHREPPRGIDALLLCAGAASMLCLGAFVAVGPWIDGERRVWVLCAMGALAVLLLLVGGAGFVGSLVGSSIDGGAARRWSLVGAPTTAGSRATATPGARG